MGKKLIKDTQKNPSEFTLARNPLHYVFMNIQYTECTGWEGIRHYCREFLTELPHNRMGSQAGSKLLTGGN